MFDPRSRAKSIDVLETKGPVTITGISVPGLVSWDSNEIFLDDINAAWMLGEAPRENKDIFEYPTSLDIVILLLATITSLDEDDDR